MQESADETTERAFDAENSQRHERIIELKRKEKELADLLEKKRDWLSFRHKQVLKLGATASDKSSDFLIREKMKPQRRFKGGGLPVTYCFLTQKEHASISDRIPLQTPETAWWDDWYSPKPTSEPPTPHTESILESLQRPREKYKQAPQALPRPPQFEAAQELLDALYARQAEIQPLMRLARNAAAMQQHPITPAIPPPSNPTTVRQRHLAELGRTRLWWYKLEHFEEIARECERTMGEDEEKGVCVNMVDRDATVEARH
ncbi:hypothetical protein M427DRAFT_30593 [Gonapodya prolifera JEL478]|uniref:Uncharacterized protein n=1 Tax=Gonapodya prolifera (strain JEL478) TaxID=1344416 RepID=A0A139AK08_GONPJ|nr:hypothetical protein M427DRAFT_30593 [Gonapodya prolifera JEL478]|eukprot:KXS17111.1 hypothetical protein M427DRAFT_30593 [Gonapodya prolifera JEL478]